MAAGVNPDRGFQLVKTVLCLKSINIIKYWLRSEKVNTFVSEGHSKGTKTKQNTSSDTAVHRTALTELNGYRGPVCVCVLHI